MALAGMDHEQAGVARRGEDGGDRLHRAGELADVVAERLAEAPSLHEIALHVDDDERGLAPVERDRRRLRRDCPA
ncbi:hypothetical protein ACVWY2_009096 [Bradyrhizobium sp. JR6.1]